MTSSLFNSATTAVGLALLVAQTGPLNTADTSPAIIGLFGERAPANPAVAAPDAEPRENLMSKAAALLREMGAAGVLSPDRIAMADQALELLSLWKVPEPTELSDGSDGDFSLIWRKQGLAASLTYTENEVVGYAHSPQMLEPWMFEKDRISIPELNVLGRALG